MASIVKYEWNFGDGQTSGMSSPLVQFTPGVFDTSVTITFDDGSTVTVSESDFISVTEDKQNLVTSGYLTLDEDQARHAVSYHYGTKPSNASGWSRNTGENWVWPESQAAISHQIIDGVDYLLVWDMYDDLQYCINPRNTVSDTTTYLDKDSNEIACSVTFKAATGESTAYDIMHQESIFHMKNDIDSKSMSTNMTIDVTLIGEDGVVLEEKLLSADSEVVFKEQSMYEHGEHKYMQLKFGTDKSKFLLAGYDSYFKVDDKMRMSITGQDGDTFAIVAGADYVLSIKNDYEADIVSGTPVDTDMFHLSSDTAPDGFESAIELDDDLVIGNAESAPGTLVFWYKGVEPIIYGFTFVDTGIVKNSFHLVYAIKGTLPADITFTSGSILYDIRVYYSTIDSSVIMDYGNNVKLHVGR
jgi:hypothetical protein